MSAAIKPTRIDSKLNFQIRAASTSKANKPACACPFARSIKTKRAISTMTLEENPPVRVYDTSGPWGDPSQTTRRA